MSNGKLKAIIAEDDENSRVLLHAALSAGGYAVTSAANGRDALTLAQRDPPDIIVSDILMPEMDGYDFCLHAKQDPQLRTVPFVFYTATYTDTKDQELAASLGAARFIVKPIDMSAMLNILSEVVRQAQAKRVAEPPPSDERDLQAAHQERVQAKLNKKLQELEFERRRLEASEQRFRDFAEASADWFWETDADFVIRATTGGPPELLSWRLNELPTSNPQPQTAPDADLKATRAIERHEPFQDLIIDFRGRDGKLVSLRISGKPLFDGGGRFLGYRGVARDVSETMALMRQIEYLATHDELTKLPNRSLFRDKLSQALARAQRESTRVILFFIDIDHFKVINDTLGHDAGDRLLLEAAKRIAHNIRSTDTLARLGGDEFVLIMEGGSPNDAHRVALSIIQSFTPPIVVGDQKIFVTVSIGLSVYPTDTMQPETLIAYADLAMYRAKEKGRNNFQYYTDGLNTSAGEWLIMENGLRNAMEQGELFLEFQPQIDLLSGAIVGVEALLRWLHPVMGLIMPGKFIPIAEQSGLTVRLGQWVLDRVCRQMRCWDEEGVPIQRVSINISGRHVRNQTICEDARLILGEHGISPSRICLEITEHTLLDGTDSVQATLRELRGRGIALSLDDFGMGYSSLSYLKRFPLHEVKIDRSFVAGIATPGDDFAITRAVIGLGHAFSLRVVGEGVENAAQAEILRREGCTAAQGYYFAKPLGEADLRRWLMIRRPRQAS